MEKESLEYNANSEHAQVMHDCPDLRIGSFGIDTRWHKGGGSLGVNPFDFNVPKHLDFGFN